MVGLHRTLMVVAVGSALGARPALCQQGSSVSLTHTVSVTVPPRVKVKVADLPSSTEMASSQPLVRSDGLAVSVRATQSWALSIGSLDGSSKLQWSAERSSGFSAVGNEALVTSGDVLPGAAVATVFLRDTEQSGGDGSDAVVLTVVAP